MAAPEAAAADEPIAEPVDELAPKAPGPLQASWRAVSIESTFSVSGGFMGAKKSFPVVSKTVTVRRERDGVVTTVPATYIKVEKNADWVLKAVAGNKAQKGALKRTKVIEDLRRNLVMMSSSDAAVAGEGANATLDEDPMAALDMVCDEEPAAKRRYNRKRAKCKEVKVSMPLRAQCAYPGNKEKRDVSIMADSTNQLWLLKEDVPWLLVFLADECGFGGVAIESEAAVAEANCDAVPGLRVEWDFQSNDAWTATFVEGPLLGQPSIKCRLSGLTEEKWNKMNAIHAYEHDYASASASDRKRVAYDYIAAHCAEMLKKSDANCASASSTAVAERMA